MKSLFGLAALIMSLFAADFSHAGVIYHAFLNGPNESPPVASPGTGFALVKFDLATHTLSVDVTFADLIGMTTVAHIHAPTAVPFTGNAGVATALPTFPGFPGGVTSGAYSAIFDTSLVSTFNPVFVVANGGTAAGAESAFAAALADGKAYLNIHTTFAPSGEIRGFLVPAPVSVSEPSILSLAFVGGLGLVWAGRKRRRRSA